MKLLNINIWVFTFMLIITIIVNSFYIFIKPSHETMQYNVSPFPDIFPTGIPPAKISHKNLACEKSLKPCISNVECEKKCGVDYKCTLVNEGEEAYLNGIKIPPGNWCLRKKKNFGCGTYTGRSVWSTDPDTQDEEWDCMCLYPELFGNPEGKEGPCMTQFACVAENVVTPQTPPGGKNILQDVKDSKKTWDPSNPNFYPPDGKSPYAWNEDGTGPMFSCACNQNKGKKGIQFVKLPGDPYKCYAAPCTEAHTQVILDSNYNCDCSKLTDGGPFAQSNKDGMCRIQQCGNKGTWDYKNKTCSCPKDYGYLLTCNSNYYDHGSGAQKCPSYAQDNAAGQICANVCTVDGEPIEGCVKNICQHGSCCEPTSATDYQCLCPSDTTGEYCDVDAGKTCKLTGANKDWVYKGKNCERKCLPEGVTVYDQDHITGKRTWTYTKADCCEGCCHEKHSFPWVVSDYNCN